MNDYIIQCEKIYIDDMKKFNNDKLIAKDILKKDILKAKLNNSIPSIMIICDNFLISPPKINLFYLFISKFLLIFKYSKFRTS